MVVIDREHQAHKVQATSEEFRAALQGADSHGMLDLQIEGEGSARKAMVKHVDNDPLAKQILSVTLQEVAQDDMVKADLPVVATGHNDSADEADIVLTAVTTELKVKAKVADLPEAIEVDLSSLAVGDHLRAGDVKLPNGVELLSPPDAILFSVSQVRTASTDEESGESTDAEGAVPSEESA